MVLLTTTPLVLEILTSLPPVVLSTLQSTIPQSKPVNDEPNTKHDPPSLPTTIGAPISHSTLIALSRLRSKNETVKVPSLNTLLRGTKPYTEPAPPKPPPSPEYLALMARLRLEQEEREYAALVAKQRSHLSLSADFSNEGEDNISPSLVFNILLSIVMCAVAMFQLTKWWPNDGVRVLASLAVGLVVGVAEVGVYSIYLLKVKTARQKEWSMKEKKTFVAEYRPGDDGVDAAGRGGDGKLVTGRAVGEKEAIWGKGVNGGMRRRVREKWEKEHEKDGKKKS